MLTDQFLVKLKQRYMDTVPKYTNDAFIKKEWSFVNGTGSIEVNVSRGDVFEKACVSNIRATVTIPGRDYQSTIQWLGIQTFPSNPQVPLFMGVFEHVSEQSLERCPGFFDVYPVIAFDEDRGYLEGALRAVAEKHGRTYTHLREGYLKMFQVKEAGSGIGYGAGIAFGPEETNFAYFQDAAEAIFAAYFHIVDNRKNLTPSPEQVDLMFAQRAEWVRFTFMNNRFFKGGISLGVPPESFMLHMLPPVVKF